jgi:hypothetical protein
MNLSRTASRRMIQLGNYLCGRDLLSLLYYIKIFSQLNAVVLVMMVSRRTS